MIGLFILNKMLEFFENRCYFLYSEGREVF